MNRGLHHLLVAVALALAASAAAAAPTSVEGQPDASPHWLKIRSSLFAQREITPAGSELLTLEMPVRAEDAAVVPIAVRTRLPQGAAPYVEKLYLVIDNNPSPIAAVFSFTPGSGQADIETRVRIDEYTHVRAIAQMSDGRLLMATRWVKASGGCSAPPGKDPQAAQASLGKMRLRVEGEPAPGRPVLAQLMVSHPNSSGLAMDQLTRHYVPAHFVRRIDISYAGRPVLSADLDISISENPNLRFWFIPQEAGGELKAQVVDNRDLQFESSLRLQPARGS
ncbi:quinoprotein dehydrogenase-associated SoxYZ-like carrier [Aquincola sp. MAHUQ-54]|uniref:Quinoprotein dehydrogenase-associated SoxYZ-like carrier n=1 Tax=Aquincola agrisoli TaxID=3119538 RepID=A0AAW9QBB8_9BURK